MRRALWLLAVCGSAACSHGSGAGVPVRLADGGYALACNRPLRDCLRYAERVCGDQGYMVTTARDLRELLGHESGQSQVMVEKSDATVYCGNAAPLQPIALKRPAEPATEATVSPPPASVPALAPAPAATPKAAACVPGASQACIGPAGCNGGQVCSADGSHFEACDCGSK